MNQLFHGNATTDPNKTATKYYYDRFRHDVSTYLSLQTELQDIPHKRPNRGGPQRQKIRQSRLEKYGINICDPQHDPVREVLLQHSQELYRYLVQTVLPLTASDDVTSASLVAISSKDSYFLDLIETYQYDPCEMRKKQSSGQTMRYGKRTMVSALDEEF